MRDKLISMRVSLTLNLVIAHAIIARVFNRVAFLKAKVEPINDAGQQSTAPRKPDVYGGWHILQVAGTLAILVGEQHLSAEDAYREPSKASFARLIFALLGAPCREINVRLAVSNGAKAEPEEEARNWEKVLRRD